VDDEVTVKLSREVAEALTKLVAQIDSIHENSETVKTHTTVAHIVSTMRTKLVSSANGAFSSWCGTSDYTVSVECVCFPEAWRGQGKIMSDAPLVVWSRVCPALGKDRLHLPGATREEDGEPVYLIFNTLSEAYTFYHEKLLPTVEALAELADETLLVDRQEADSEHKQK